MPKLKPKSNAELLIGGCLIEYMQNVNLLGECQNKIV